jgi:hypothetical protein
MSRFVEGCAATLARRLIAASGRSKNVRLTPNNRKTRATACDAGVFDCRRGSAILVVGNQRLGAVDRNIVSWNPVISWLRRIERLKFAE